MAFKTLSGQADTLLAAPSGINEWVSGDTPTAAEFNNNLADAYGYPYYSVLAGVMSGGVCTFATLVVTVPTSTIYYARQLFVSDSGTNITVPDAATTYVWGCSDGELRITSSTTPPASFDTRTACILCSVAASGGVITSIDLAVQQRCRYADPANRVQGENAGLWAPIPDSIPSGLTLDIPTDHQITVWDELLVTGTVYVSGKLRLE